MDAILDADKGCQKVSFPMGCSPPIDAEAITHILVVGVAYWCRDVRSDFIHTKIAWIYRQWCEADAAT